MRKFVPLLVACALFVPAAALALPSLAGNTKDGTLSVKKGDGMVYLNARGAIIGRFDKGTIRVTDLSEDDGTDPVVKGCDDWSKDKDATDNVKVCSGKDVRFRVVQGKFKVRITRGVNIDLSAVGRSDKNQVELDGSGEADVDGDGASDPDGTYSFNDAELKSLPDKKDTFTLAG